MRSWPTSRLDSLVLAGVSGGRDSLALADAVAFEGPRAGLRVGALVVDHQLQAEVGRCRVRCSGNSARSRVRSRRGADCVRRDRRAGQRLPRATRVTRRCLKRLPGSVLPSYYLGTRSTTKRRRCCSAWHVGRGPGRCRGCRHVAGCSDALARRRSPHDRRGLRRCWAQAMGRPAQ